MQHNREKSPTVSIAINIEHRDSPYIANQQTLIRVRIYGDVLLCAHPGVQFHKRPIFQKVKKGHTK